MADRVAAPAARRAVLAAGLARARLRRDRGGDPEHRRLDGFVRRRGASGCRRACTGADRGRSSATGSTAAVDRRRPGRTSTSSTRSCGSSTGGCKDDPERHRRRAGRRLVRARVRRARAIPGGVARALAGGRRLSAPGDARARRGAFAGGALPLVGRSRGRRRGPVAARRRPLPAPADRRDPRRRCRGAPADRRTGWRATSGRTRRSARPTRARPWSSRSSILGVPEVAPPPRGRRARSRPPSSA